MDRMSRWKCTVILGVPVLPEVGASNATSSAAVSTAVNSPGFAAARAARSSYATTCNGSGCASSMNLVSTKAIDGWVRSTIGRSSRVRSAAMVVTTTPPALSTPSHAATVHGLLGDRSRTRCPGTRPRSSTSTCATWFERVRSSPYVQTSPAGVRSAGRSGPNVATGTSISSVAALRRSG